MAKNPQYSRRHYEHVARIMRDMKPVDDAKALEYWYRLCGRFGGMFAADNPKFDAVRFIDACDK